VERGSFCAWAIAVSPRRVAFGSGLLSRPAGIYEQSNRDDRAPNAAPLFSLDLSPQRDTREAILAAGRQFLEYLKLEKHFSDYTVKSYGADLIQFGASSSPATSASSPAPKMKAAG